MPKRKRPANVTRLTRDEQRAECGRIRGSMEAILLCQVHGPDLTSETLTNQGQREVESHCLDVLVQQLQDTTTKGKTIEAQTLVGGIHSDYLPAVIDRLTPLPMSPCTDDDNSPTGQ